MTGTLGCKDFSTGYDRRTAAVVSGVSIDIAPGQFTALLGPNGCGKSTLLRGLMGFLPAWEGAAQLDDTPVQNIARKSFARRVGFLPQENQCPDYLTVGELLELGVHSHGGLFSLAPKLTRDRAQEVLAEVGLQGLGAAQVNRLSGGQRQRAFIGMVLAQDADILLLDEPVNHLDIRYQYEVLTLVRDLMARRGRTVVAVLHDLNLAGAFADRVALMEGGKLTAHAPCAEVLTVARIAQVWGIEGEVVTRGDRVSFLPDIPKAERLGDNIRAIR